MSGPIDPEKFLMTTQTMEVIAECVEQLPLQQRLAFCFKEIDDRLTTEICNILRVTATHLGVLLFRARNQLRECIEKKS
jgi:RNA polymerase sigma-70 factor (ECF subfamily)